MHCLHKILVYIPDVVSDKDGYEKTKLEKLIRSYAENETESFCGHAFEWRETESAGGWRDVYPKNILFAEDDPERFVSELTDVMQQQQNELQFCLKQLENTIGTDLLEISKKILDQNSYNDYRNGVDRVTAFYLHHIAAYLYGEYNYDSYFYNVNAYTARIYKTDIEAAKMEPEKWALVMFDYHN